MVRTVYHDTKSVLCIQQSFCFKETSTFFCLFVCFVLKEIVNQWLHYPGIGRLSISMAPLSWYREIVNQIWLRYDGIGRLSIKMAPLTWYNDLMVPEKLK